MEWIKTWTTPPSTLDALYSWKIYTRVFDDLGCPTPGYWIVEWLKNGHVTQNIMDDKYNYYTQEAIRWYIYECRE